MILDLSRSRLFQMLFQTGESVDFCFRVRSVQKNLRPKIEKNELKNRLTEQIFKKVGSVNRTEIFSRFSVRLRFDYLKIRLTGG